MDERANSGTAFLQWALPRMGYRWDGFRKPRGQVLRRVRERLHELGLAGGYPEYKSYLEHHPEEWDVLDRLCDVTISKFFRDRKVWEYLRDTILPELLNRPETGSHPVAVWSIGCCNGEEAYSISMINEHLALHRGDGNSEGISILATDRNEQVLERARIGRYPAGALKELTEGEIERFFHPVAEEGVDEDVEIDERLKRPVTFERRDIRDSMPDEEFDLVLCRNLAFTYFSEEEQRRFLQRLKTHLRRDGYLVVGANEELPEVEWLARMSRTHPVFKKF